MPTGSGIGNSTTNAVVGSHPNTVCQICHYQGHSAKDCPQQYTPRQVSPQSLRLLQLVLVKLMTVSGILTQQLHPL